MSHLEKKGGLDAATGGQTEQDLPQLPGRPRVEAQSGNLQFVCATNHHHKVEGGVVTAWDEPGGPPDQPGRGRVVSSRSVLRVNAVSC